MKYLVGICFQVESGNGKLELNFISLHSHWKDPISFDPSPNMPKDSLFFFLGGGCSCHRKTPTSEVLGGTCTSLWYMDIYECPPPPPRARIKHKGTTIFFGIGAEEVGKARFNVATPTYASVTSTRHVQHMYYRIIYTKFIYHYFKRGSTLNLNGFSLKIILYTWIEMRQFWIFLPVFIKSRVNLWEIGPKNLNLGNRVRPPLNRGVMNFQKYLGNIFVTPYLMIKNFMTPHPELQCWRNM